MADDDGNSGVPAAAESSVSPGLVKFLSEFMKGNPDLAREMSTRMNAVINNQKLGAAKDDQLTSSAQPTPPSPQPAVSPGAKPEPAISGGAGQTTSAIPYALGQRTAPNVQSIGTPTLNGWQRRMQGRQE